MPHETHEHWAAGSSDKKDPGKRQRNLKKTDQSWEDLLVTLSRFSSPSILALQ